MQGGKNGQGPNLWGIIGRESGSVEGFAYSAANKNSGIKWSDKHLEVYLQDPKKVSLQCLVLCAARWLPRGRGVGHRPPCGKRCKHGVHLSATGCISQQGSRAAPGTATIGRR